MITFRRKHEDDDKQLIDETGNLKLENGTDNEKNLL